MVPGLGETELPEFTLHKFLKARSCFEIQTYLYNMTDMWTWLCRLL